MSVKPADLKGSVVGESEKKTAAILERALGSVLFIDEACEYYNDSAPSRTTMPRHSLAPPPCHPQMDLLPTTHS